MFVDASALLAILLSESDALRFSRLLEAADELFVSPIVVFEVVTAIMREHKASRRVAQDKVERALRSAGIQIIPVTESIGDIALDAFDRFGKGRGHKAQLNMGDCFAYACAKFLGVALLYKGDDFAKTDLA